MKYIFCIILILGLSLPALAADIKDVESYVTENFVLKQGETLLDTAIRLLSKLKEIRPERETVETSLVEKGQFGRTHQIYETRYEDTGELISSREEIISYYDSGELKEIMQKWFDCKGKMVRERTISYFKDGRKPVVSEGKEVP